ncbi:MAG: tetratricopeptide repeat protein [Idiomarina sp.]|nr:tetratricopeptide repeat protein [Idiomarina sp.]
MTKHFSSTILAVAMLLGATSLASKSHANEDGVGFTIPSQEEIDARRDRRQSFALNERLSRRVIQAFELYEEEDVLGAMRILEDSNPRTNYERAYIARMLGSLAAALDEEQARPQFVIEQLEKALEFDILSFNDQRASLQLLANMYLQTEQYQKAIDMFIRYLQFAGEWNPDVLFRIAASHMELENYPRVIPFARKAIENYERPNRNPYVLMVGAYFQQGNIPGAISVMEEGIVVMPEETRWWSQLGAFYALNEEFDKSLATLNIAYDAGYLERSADFRYLVQMYANNSIPFHAGEVMERHLRRGDIEPTRANWASAARSFFSAREFTRSAEAYEQAVAVAEDDENRIAHLRSQGDALMLAEKYVEASRSFRRAIELGPDNDTSGRLYMSLAEAHFYANQYRQALAAAENAQRFSATRRNAESWANYIRDTAERRGASI